MFFRIRVHEKAGDQRFFHTIHRNTNYHFNLSRWSPGVENKSWSKRNIQVVMRSRPRPVSCDKKWVICWWPKIHPKKGGSRSLKVFFSFCCLFGFALLCFALLCFTLRCVALLCFALLCFALLCFALLPGFALLVCLCCFVLFLFLFYFVLFLRELKGLQFPLEGCVLYNSYAVFKIIYRSPKAIFGGGIFTSICPEICVLGAGAGVWPKLERLKIHIFFPLNWKL